MTTTKHQRTTRITLATTRFGTRQPMVEVTLPRGSSHRTLKARLHQLAASLELKSDREGWVVGLETASDTRGWVYLELVGATEPEAERGLALLKRVTGE